MLTILALWRCFETPPQQIPGRGDARARCPFPRAAFRPGARQLLDRLATDLPAYAICGVGAISIAAGLLGKRGAWRWVSWSPLLGGAACILAFALFAFESRLAGPPSIASGVLNNSFAVAALLYGVKIGHGGSVSGREAVSCLFKKTDMGLADLGTAAAGYLLFIRPAL